jgi:pimeloyl-ACP methyl ester carboxylesterase
MILVNSIGYQQELPSTLSYNTIPVLREFNALILSWSKAQHRVEEAYGDDEKITDDVIRRNQDLGLRKGNRSSLIKVARTIEKDTDQRDLGNRIKYIQTPTLVMWGEEDEWTPVSVMKHFKVDLPNMDIISYEGVGHLPMEELPRQSARDALHYLQTGEPGELPGNQEQGW